MDWNWFYSAVAQSSAAIVGIFGAFVFTKIIANQGQLRQRRADMRDLLQNARRLSDETGIGYFEWYNRQSNKEYLKDLKNTLILEEELRTSEYYFHTFGFSKYQPIEDVIEEITDLVEAEKARRARPPRETSSRSQGLLGHLSPGYVPIDLPMIARDVDKREAELETLDKMAVAVRAHCQKVEAFVSESRTHPESSLLITFSIVFSLALFYVGVVVPLAWLPVVSVEMPPRQELDPTIRIGILASVALLFTGVMVLFMILNLRMRLHEGEMADLEPFAKEAEYSEFLGYRANNMERIKSVV